MTNSIATLAHDAYKEFHPYAYHPEVEEVYANYTNRSGKLSNIPNGGIGGVVNLGPQFFCKDFLIGEFNKTFFNLPKEDAIHQHARIIRSMLGKEFNDIRLRELHDLGYLPLRVKTIAEGTIVPYGIPSVTVASTKPGFQWLTNSIETVMSCEISGMSTSATTATAYHMVFREFAEKTGLPPEFVPFQGHDFSMRGMIFGRVGSYMSTFGHLASGLVGTDTIGGIPFAENYYNANCETELVGCSVDATEHSVTCSWIEEGEEEFVKYLMNDASPEGILSIVADTWDFWNFVTVILPNLKDAIIQRKGTVVVRPDSGDPADILCGDPLGTTEAERKGLVECLWDIFGGTMTTGANGKQYKLLDEHIGAIYGDSITLERQRDILQRLMDKGFASKVVLGIGSYTYQYVTRDTHGSAVKATSVVKAGKRIPIFKDPKTDQSKKSAKGLLYVGYNQDGEIIVEDDVSVEREQEGLLETIFENGKMVKETSLSEIREIIKGQL